MRPRALAIGLLLLALAGPGHALVSVWDRLPAGLSPDSLAKPLQQLESANPRAVSAGAAYALGQYRYARGEYRWAAEAFGRAAARLQGYDRAEARYRQGLAWLGASEGGRARAAFEEVSSLSDPLRPLAQLGLARALALTGESELELETLQRLIQSPAGEAEPAALERYAVLCDRAHRVAEALSARDRLERRWPRSLEAARLRSMRNGEQP